MRISWHYRVFLGVWWLYFEFASSSLERQSKVNASTLGPADEGIVIGSGSFSPEPPDLRGLFFGLDGLPTPVDRGAGMWAWAFPDEDQSQSMLPSRPPP